MDSTNNTTLVTVIKDVIALLSEVIATAKTHEQTVDQTAWHNQLKDIEARFGKAIHEFYGRFDQLRRQLTAIYISWKTEAITTKDNRKKTQAIVTAITALVALLEQSMRDKIPTSTNNKQSTQMEKLNKRGQNLNKWRPYLSFNKTRTSQRNESSDKALEKNLEGTVSTATEGKRKRFPRLIRMVKAMIGKNEGFSMKSCVFVNKLLNQMQYFLFFL